MSKIKDAHFQGTMAQFCDSQRNGQKLHFGGFIYVKHRANEEKTTWRCERFKKDPNCRGRLTSCREMYALKCLHNHLPSGAAS